jgi:ketosteroid isomerase-like protein
MTAAHPNVTLLRELYGTKGPPESVAHLFHEDAVWHLPGAQPLSGDHRGRAAILKAMRYFDGIQLEILDIVANDSHAIVLLRARSDRRGKRYDMQEFDVFRFQDGTIAEFWSFSADQKATDAHWA